MVLFFILLGFTLTIFVHELGHFLFARRAGMKVDIFSIGMGPRIFTFFKDKQGTEYILSLIPIGGFVKIKGQEDLPTNGERANCDTDSYNAKTPIQRLLVISFGVIMNVIFAWILLSAAFIVGIPFIPNKIAGVEPNSTAYHAGFKAGDEILSIGGATVETGEDILSSSALSKEGQNTPITFVREGVTNTILAASTKSEIGGRAFNDFGFILWSKPLLKNIATNSELYSKGFRNNMVILSATYPPTATTRHTIHGISYLIQENPGKELTFLTRSEFGKIETLVAKVGVQSNFDTGYTLESVVDVLPGTPAFLSGMNSGDQVTSIDGIKIDSYNDIIKVGLNWNDNNERTFIINRGGAEAKFKCVPDFQGATERYIVGVTVSKEAKVNALSGFMQRRYEQQLPSLMPGDQQVKVEFKGENVIYKFLRAGVKGSITIPIQEVKTAQAGYLFSFTEEQKKIQYSFPLAFVKAVPRMAIELKETVTGVSRLFSGAMSIKMFGGPIQIFTVSHYIGKEKGAAYFLLIFVKIGLSLAVVNFLPIPPLDGGHAVFILFEMVTRRRPPEKLVMVLQSVGTLLMLLLFVVVMFNDVQSLFK